MKNKMIRGLLFLLLVCLIAMLSTGCGKNADDLETSPDNSTGNALSLRDLKEDSYLYNAMKYLYDDSEEKGIALPDMKERVEVGNLLTESNYNGGWGEEVYLEYDDALFGGTEYYRTLNESKVVYWGELNDEGRPHGAGIIYLKYDYFDDYNPNTLLYYIGTFDNGYYEGYGIQFNIPDIDNDYFNQTACEINYDNVHLFNYPIYEGYFTEGLQNGEGTEIICNIGAYNMETGEVLLDIDQAEYVLYMGNFNKGALEGEVKVYYHGVIEYEGEMHDGDYNGYGKLYFTEHPGVLQYEGEFSGGKYHGDGILYDEEGGVLFEGEFSNGDIA